MIWYSHVNEDSTVEREIALNGNFDRIFCIAGSGERLIALLDLPSISEIHAIDSNIEALRLLALKLGALKRLPPDRYLQFCGFAAATEESRIELWQQIKSELDLETGRYWEGRAALIRKGIVNAGHFERYLGGIRPFIRIFLGKGFIECWTSRPDRFHRFPWKRWRLLSRMFSWRIAYLLTGNRDPAFVSAGARGACIQEGLRYTLEQNLVPDSFMWHLIFKGHVRDMNTAAVPPSVRPELLQRCQQSLVRGRVDLRLHHADLLHVVRAMDPDYLSRMLFSVSDLLSFCDFSYVRKLLDLLAGRNNTVVIRSFLRNTLSPEQLRCLRDRCVEVTDWSDRESTRMYRVYVLKI